MPLSRSFWLAVLLLCASAPVFARAPKECVTADAAMHMLHRDVCIAAHIYDVVQLPDGTRFLDVCAPEVADEKCGFTVVSLWEDREQVGELKQYRDRDVRIRGIVQPLHGRAGIVLSHARQFYGGPPRFRPNPLLARGFNGEQRRPPVSDPNLRAHGGRRAFMNIRNQEPLPPAPAK